MIYVMSGCGTGKLFAVISVTYPAGSVCTCSDGTTTLTAKDTSGKALFNVPSAGTWTVTARTADGSKEKSVNITITAAGQVESVTIIYVPYLYNHGDECTDLTGGWQSRALKGNDGSIAAKAPTLTKGTNSMTIQWIGSGSGVCEIIKDVDLTAYSSIKWNGTFTPSGNNNIGTKVSVIKRSSSYWYTNSAAFANISAKSLDISSLTGAYDIVIGCQNNESTETAAITEMHLE